MISLPAHIQNVLDQVTEFADQAHGDQTRKYTPERYIVHPVRVMKILTEYTTDISMLAAALLHDVLEDTPVKSEDIEAFLEHIMVASEVRKTLRFVEELTDVYVKPDFPHLNRRQRKELEVARIAKTSKDSQTIKYADIIDNCVEIVKHDRGFAGKFLFECREILRKAPNGDPRLYEKAVMTLNVAVKQL
ncbi:HD domain-containing protein [Daejeonella sp.]|uniref:HD domain-containing protein n=1 Tax=Daejeonella sp. TaxID=2805397 RepID=UPI0030C56717